MSQSDSLKSQIRRYERRLQLLKEQKALHGLDTPPSILIEIEEIEAELEALQTQLEGVAEQTTRSPFSETSGKPAWFWAVVGGVGVLTIIALIAGFVWISQGPSEDTPADTSTPKTADLITESTPGNPVVFQPPEATPTQTPTATPALPTATPVLPTPDALFGDDFNGTELDEQKWVAIEGAGRIDVERGIVRLTSVRNTFPLIRPRENPFPAKGDFRVNLSMRYLNAAERGVGFRVGTTLADYGANQALNQTELFKGRIIEVWQDIQNWHISVNDDNTEVHVLTSPELGFHEITINYRDNIYNIILDGKEVYVSNPTLERPTLFWFGNPARTVSDGAWSSLEIDHIAVESLHD